MTVVETLNNKLTLGGKVNSPFYFTGAGRMVILKSNTWGMSAYPLFISFDLAGHSINRAIDQVEFAFNSAIKSDLVPSTGSFYQEFKQAIIDVLVDLKMSLK